MDTNRDLCEPTAAPVVRIAVPLLRDSIPLPTAPAEVRAPVPAVRAARSPLPAGFMLQYFAPFCYSPRGTSTVASRSRQLRDAVKRSDSSTLTQLAEHTVVIAKLLAPEFLEGDFALIPAPAHLPYRTLGPPTPAEVLCRALHRAGVGTIVWPALYRRTAIAKSAWSRPASRPDFLEHFASLRLNSLTPPTRHLLLVDDFVTRGRTLLAAAAVLHRAFPRAHIRALPLIRTEGISSDIDAIATPVTGIVRYVAGDALRSP
jgi:predicted amidophosphoribosyltransferase